MEYNRVLKQEVLKQEVTHIMYSEQAAVAVLTMTITMYPLDINPNLTC